MGLLDLFRRGGRVPEERAVQRMSIEDQLGVLETIGIRPRVDDFIAHIEAEWGREEVETGPYWTLLYTLGGERETPNGWEPLSDDIHIFDIGCIVDPGSYVAELENLVRIARGACPLERIADVVDWDARRASVSFSLFGRSYTWAMRYDDDHLFDIDIVGRINVLLRDAGANAYFCACEIDKNLVVVFATPQRFEVMQQALSLPVPLEMPFAK